MKAHRTLYKGIYAHEAPEYLQKILRRGGINRFNEPNYRLVRAEARFRLSGGEWKKWDRRLSQSERNELKNRPLGTVSEVRAIPMYPIDQGTWILERWLAPEKYGDRDTWYKPAVIGGTMKYTDKGYLPSQGEYPTYGDYESTEYRFPPDAMTEAVISQAVGMLEQAREATPTDPRRRAELEQQYAVTEDAMLEQAWAQETMGELEESGMGWQPHSLQGRAEISKLARSIGINEHPF